MSERRTRAITPDPPLSKEQGEGVSRSLRTAHPRTDEARGRADRSVVDAPRAENPKVYAAAYMKAPARTFISQQSDAM